MSVCECQKSSYAAFRPSSTPHHFYPDLKMGIVKSEERKKMELEEFLRMLVACAGVHRRKEQEEFGGKRFPSRVMDDGNDKNNQDRFVCVTGGVSFLGLAIVNHLLTRGYSVRIVVDNPGIITLLLIRFQCFACLSERVIVKLSVSFMRIASVVHF